MTMMPTVSLVLAGALALINIWLSLRVGQVRRSEQVSVGDAGNERVIRRMRAHANFTENALLVWALVLVIELAVGTSPWLWAAAVALVIARVLHGIGMDGWYLGRSGGTLVTFALEILLGLWAIALPFAYHAPRLAPTTEAVPARG